MTQALQKKFIIVSMFAITVLLFVLVNGINIANLCFNKWQISRRLELLMENEQRMISNSQNHMEDEENPFIGLPPAPKEGNPFAPPIDEDTAQSLRFFTINYEEKEIIHMNLSRISAVNEEQAEEYAQEVIEKAERRGKIHGYQYLMEDNLIIFLDTSTQRNELILTVAISLVVAALCWLGMFVLVAILSRKAIRPIAENVEKQKNFVTDAGHEIKTPLAIIMANLDAMELIAGTNKWSKNIRSQTERLSGLTQDLLTLAKMEDTKLELVKTELEADALVIEAIQAFQEPAALKQVQIKQEIQPHVCIKANKEQFQRILSILFDNAIKYVDDGGQIFVSLEKEERQAVLRVGNTCAELPQNPPQQLFDRFYRGDSARTQKSGGYGIGLSAAKAIVEAHKGKIQASYEEGNRIVFTVRI